MPRIHAAMTDALVLSSGEPGDWQTTACLEDHRPECVAVAADRASRIFCGTFGDGLFRSTDGGETWDPVGAGVLHDDVMSIAISPHDPDTVWAGTEPSAVYRSTDGGETWEERPGLTALPSADEWYFPPRPETHHVRWIEPDPHNANRLYVGIEAGAFVFTSDGGKTWEERPPGSRRDNHQLAVHPDAPGRVYAAAGDGYAESRDGGETWEHPQEGLDHRYVWSVAVDRGDPATVLVSSASGAYAAHSQPAESYVYRRTNNDAWERLDDRGLPTGEGVLRAVLEAGGSGEFYAANNAGVFRSRDAGASWRALEIPWEAYADQTVRGLAVV